MIGQSHGVKVFLTGSTGHLRRSLVRRGHPVGKVIVSAFADAERRYSLAEGVAGQAVGLVASVLPAPESLFDLLAFRRLLVENGAGPVTLVIPYLGYARQDRRSREGEAAIGVMVAELLAGPGAERLVVLDVHSERIRRALGPGVSERTALPLFAAALAKKPPEVVVAPDAGSVARAGRLADLLAPRPEVALIDKYRPRPNVAVARRIEGNVRGRRVLILDDMIDTGGTLVSAVRLLEAGGVASIEIAATHGLFSAGAIEKLASLPIRRILVTNTLPQARHPKLRCLDIVELLNL